jgi:hypothetical protein|tara:strand:- start:31448 stop:31666 length:219 start_codon:yes stop_codon:yes gene_type:complete
MRVITIFLFLAPMPAFAHWGHLPELVGHSHWIGLAAAAAAAATAAWGLCGNSKDKEVKEEISEGIEEELQGE